MATSNLAFNPITGGVEVQVDGTAVATFKTVGTGGGMSTPAAQTPMFSAYQSAISNVGTSATLVPYQVKLFDTASAFNNTNATVGNTLAYAFNPLVAGYYQVTASISLASAPAAGYIMVYKNGVLYQQFTLAANNGVFQMSSLVYLDGSGLGANSNVQVYGLSGTAYNTVIQPSTCFFQAALIARA